MAAYRTSRRPASVTGSAVVVSDGGTIARQVTQLAMIDPLFGALRTRNGVPPLWRREPTYATIVRLILEQQVSLASATAAFTRLTERVGEVTPDSVVSSTPEELRVDGFSRQKAGYVVGIAQRILDGEFDPRSLPRDPATAREVLLSIRGIGPWTASCFLMFAMGAVDVWPTGDRALHVSIARNLGLEDVPSRERADAMADRWSPYRSVAARMLWHDYLGGPAYREDPRAGFV
jgi:DNA-3-methyladenine glycosylase II